MSTEKITEKLTECCPWIGLSEAPGTQAYAELIAKWLSEEFKEHWVAVSTPDGWWYAEEKKPSPPPTIHTAAAPPLGRTEGGAE